MISWNGKRRWVALLLLIAGIIVMRVIPPVIPVIQLPGEIYPRGVPTTNTFVASIVVWILIGLLTFYVARNMPKSSGEVPKGGFYNIFELLFEGLYNFVANIVGEKYLKWIFSVFMTIFLVVLLSNWLELVPGVDSIGFLHEHTTVNPETGETEYEDGYEAMLLTGNIYALNPSCPWVSPAEAETFTAEQQAARAEAGCKTGTGAPVESEHHDEAVAGEAEAASEEVTEAVAEADVVAEGEAEAEVVAAAEGEAEAHHAEAGDPSVPWVVTPYLRAPSTDLNMTLGLALVAVVMTQVIGFRALGLGYLGKFFNFRTLFNSPLGGIDVAVGLLELIGEFARILSFAFRLLGNIFAGSILLFVMSFLIPFLPWPFFILEFFVGVIQALVFALLTAIFMNLATASHHGEEHGEDHAEEFPVEAVSEAH